MSKFSESRYTRENAPRIITPPGFTPGDPQIITPPGSIPKSDSGLFSKFPAKQTIETPVKNKTVIKSNTNTGTAGQSGVVGVTISSPSYNPTKPEGPAQYDPGAIIADKTKPITNAANTTANEITNKASNFAASTKEKAEGINIFGLNLWTIAIMVGIFFIVKKFI